MAKSGETTDNKKEVRSLKLPSDYTAAQGWTGTHANARGDAAFWAAAHASPVQGQTSAWGYRTDMGVPAG